jgi:hypothetical protein
MRDLVELHDPDAPLSRVVVDDLSTHHARALYEAFSAPGARRIVRRVEFRCTPKHGSRLDIAEIEIGVLTSQRLDRRIPHRQTPSRETAAWLRGRNEAEARINWLFRVDRARAKLGKVYPQHETVQEREAA